MRISIAAIWMLSPPVLTVLAFKRWKRQERPSGLKGVWPVFAAAGVVTNWLLFVLFLFAGQIGGFGSHYMTTRLADVFLLVSLALLVCSIFSHVGRWQLSLASALVLALWFGSEMVT